MKSAIKELKRGRELAVQLRAMMLAETNTDFEPNSLTRALTTELMSAFSKAIAAIDDGGVKLSSSGRKRRTKSAHTSSYRRRSNPYSSCTKTVAKTLDDGHSWRKYGQKEIYNAKYTRSYFRCTHKYDQGCAATKQVQRSEEDPSLYVITYFGDHTCRDPAADLSCCNIDRDSFVIDFAKAASACQKSQIPVCKQEESVSNQPTPGSSSNSGLCFEMPWLGESDESVRMVEELLGGKEDGDVNSKCLQSLTDGFGLDLMEESFEFGDFCCLQDDDFLR